MTYKNQNYHYLQQTNNFYWYLENEIIINSTCFVFSWLIKTFPVFFGVCRVKFVKLLVMLFLYFHVGYKIFNCLGFWIYYWTSSSDENYSFVLHPLKIMNCTLPIFKQFVIYPYSINTECLACCFRKNIANFCSYTGVYCIPDQSNNESISRNTCGMYCCVLHDVQC